MAPSSARPALLLQEYVPVDDGEQGAADVDQPLDRVAAPRECGWPGGGGRISRTIPAGGRADKLHRREK